MIQRIPHCAHWGAFTILVDGGKIVGIEPFDEDPSPSPIIQSVKDWMDPSRRIAGPMVREGWLSKREGSDRSGRGRERFVPVGWDEAARLVAGEIDRVRRLHGNDAIFAGSYGWTSAGRFHHAQSQIKRLLNLVGGYTGHKDTYSYGAGAVIARHVLGSDADYLGLGTSLEAVSNHAEVVLAFGGLTPRTAQNEAGGIARHNLETHLQRLARRKARVVLVSPRRDDTPEWLNAEWWPIVPGTDAALLLGLAGEVVARGLHDTDFLSRCCSGSDDFLAYLDGRSDGVVKKADWAASITGLDADRIRQLVPELGRRRSFISQSWSLQRAVHGEQPWWAAVGLASVLRQIGLPGGGVGFGYGSSAGTGDAVTLGPSPALPQGRKPNASFIPVARIADLLLNPGAPFTYEGQSYRYPDIRLVYWAGGNPFHHHQDLNRLSAAWERPETIVVQEPLWTPTARRADIVLPATTSIERNDIAGSRRSEYVMAMRKAVEPFGQSRSDYEIMRHVARELGVEQPFSEGRDEMGWLRHLYGEMATALRERLRHEMPSFDEFWERGHAQVPCRSGYQHMADFRADPQAHPIGTESGRIVLHSKTLEKLGYADCPPHPSWLEPPEWLKGPLAERFPFHLISPQPPLKLHSQIDYGALSQSGKVGGREAVTLNPADAQRLGLNDGDVAELWNDRGRCLAGVRISDSIRQGVASLPTGAWLSPGSDVQGPIENAGNPNVLTLDRGSSAFSGGCSAHTCLVGIRRYELEGLQGV